MRTLLLLMLVAFYGCSVNKVAPPKPYDNPEKGYIVYIPKSGYQRFDGLYLDGYQSTDIKYVKNCIELNSANLFNTQRIIGTIKYDERDQVVYLKYPFGPNSIKCEINQAAINDDIEKEILIKKEEIMNQNKEEAEEMKRLKLWRKNNPKQAANDDAVDLFVQYCELLKDATGNSFYLNDLRSMKHEYVGKNTNKIMFNIASNLIQNSGGYVYCKMYVPQIKERIYTLGLDATQ